MTPQEMRANAHQCLSWSESAHYRENREAFFALARAWMSAAIRLERDNTPLETPLPAVQPWGIAWGIGVAPPPKGFARPRKEREHRPYYMACG